MIDPTQITRYDETEAQLQEKLLFWMFAAGHNAKSSAKALDKVLSKLPQARHPFDRFGLFLHIFGTKKLPQLLKECGVGCYNLKAKAIEWLIWSGLGLKICTTDQLQACPGIGPKTARAFILHSRRNVKLAVLDTHILKHLKALGHDVPSSTPTGQRYNRIEQVWLALCDVLGKNPAEYDLEIWNRYANKRRTAE